MSLSRPRAQIAGLGWFLLSVATAYPVAALAAQAPSQPAPSQQVPAAPVPTQVPASSFPSMPAAVPQTTQPPYQSPLDQPIIIHSGQPPAPAVMPPATPDKSAIPTVPAYDPYYAEHPHGDELGSTYIPVDSPVYPMALRLYSLGYLDTAFISERPWTRRALLHILEKSSPDIVSGGNEQATQILAKLLDYLADETPAKGFARGRVYGADSVYTRLMGIDGQTLRDSYHLGQTLVNDYGRPYEPGFNNITGFSSVNEMGRFSLYVRGEYQHSPSGPGYSLALASQLSCLDQICPFAPPNDPQATIPYGTQVAQNPFRLQEATLAFHLLGHEISGGKSDSWTAPDMGGAMAWSNNAEDIYSFRIDRVEPLHIPYFSAIFGDLRYDFFVGSLKGHTAPNSPWVHSETVSIRPTHNVEFTFARTAIWGGQDFEPITLHTFLKSFFSFQDTESDTALKGSRNDPGARYSDFSFSWRLPFLTHSVTLYTDSICHDDVTPISAPRRAAYRPGVYLSHLPGLPKLDLRVEGASTDVSTTISSGGFADYYEVVQKQGYTNKGFIMGDWIGREAKGGQAWLTWHLSPDQFIQLEYLNKKTPKDFVAGGTTQNQFKVDVVKHIRRDVELNAWVQFERWKAPVPAASPIAVNIVVPEVPLYLPNTQNDTIVAAQLTWHPKLRTIQTLAGK